MTTTGLVAFRNTFIFDSMSFRWNQEKGFPGYLLDYDIYFVELDPFEQHCLQIFLFLKSVISYGFYSDL